MLYTGVGGWERREMTLKEMNSTEESIAGAAAIYSLLSLGVLLSQI